MNYFVIQFKYLNICLYIYCLCSMEVVTNVFYSATLCCIMCWTSIIKEIVKGCKQIFIHFNWMKSEAVCSEWISSWIKTSTKCQETVPIDEHSFWHFKDCGDDHFIQCARLLLPILTETLVSIFIIPRWWSLQMLPTPRPFQCHHC